MSEGSPTLEIDAGKEREMLVRRVFRDRKDLLKVAKRLELPEWRDRDGISPLEIDKVVGAIIEKFSSDEEAFFQKLNGLTLRKPPILFPWFRGRYYHLELEGMRIKIEKGAAEDFHREIRKAVRNETSGNKQGQALLWGVANTIRMYNGVQKAEWDDMMVNGSDFFTGTGKFHPTQHVHLLKKIPGGRTWKSQSGRNFDLAAEVSPIIRDELMRMKTSEVKEAIEADEKPEQLEEIDISVFDRLIEVRKVDKRLKQVMRKVLNKPGTHIALIGPPGTGKSLVASCIEKLPRSTFISGTDVTRASLRTELMNIRPRFLVFDEMDKTKGTQTMDAVQLLSEVMEEQTLTTQVSGKEAKRVSLPLNVFAMGNTYNFPINIKDRFLPVHL